MLLNMSNEIDKKLSAFFQKEVIENIKLGIIDYLGMNITSEEDSDILFKIYYDDKYSREQYAQYGNIPLINFLYEKDMISFLTMVHDKGNNKCTRFDIGLQCRNNSNMSALFAWLDENVSFWGKYKEEILNMTKMKCSTLEDYDYASLFFLGFVNDKSVIKTLKCHWLNKNRENHPIFNDDYYIKFINENGVSKLKELLPITCKALKNCGRHLWMEGIDYNKNSSEKHKIYIDYPQNLYDGLLKTFSGNKELENKIKLIREWHDIHPEFYCDGFAIGQNSQDNITLNIYFKLKPEAA